MLSNFGPGAKRLAKKSLTGFVVGVPTAAGWEVTKRITSPELYRSRATSVGETSAEPGSMEAAKAALAEAALAEALDDIQFRNQGAQ